MKGENQETPVESQESTDKNIATDYSNPENWETNDYNNPEKADTVATFPAYVSHLLDRICGKIYTVVAAFKEICA